jgi:two-component system CheB/CheR fusion protein
MKSKSSIPRKRQPSATSTSAVQPVQTGEFLIAAVGASAGGIEAFSELMKSVPPDTGMAFVLVQHLDPTHHSMLADLVSKITPMRVNEVTNGMAVEPNNVYVIPPNTTMSIFHQTLRLVPRDDSAGMPMPIDHFMRSLAELGNRAVGVVLSGSGSDGTLGLCEIQAQGGVTFAQDSASAKHDSMPRSAEAAGYTDYVLPPKGIARELARLARHPYISRDGAWRPGVDVSHGDSGLSGIFQLLRKTTGVDFAHYRQSTILRRIHRRMLVNRIDNLREYLRFAQKNPSETGALYQDLLINVTSFFRNSRVFDILKSDVFPTLLKNRGPESAIRIWTPGCASGEETYSVAIALLEFLGDKASETPFQLFGTDVSESSITKARSGSYPDNIQGDVSAERLRRFFNRSESGYRVSKTIRDRCIFAQHNLLNDPPFSQMDLLCCRNLLIYLEPPLQSRAISLFHYALRPGGYLVLGTSEGIGAATSMFTQEGRETKIFKKKATASHQLVTFSLDRHSEDPSHNLRVPSKPAELAWNAVEVQKEFDRRLLTNYAPAAVFINDDLDILHSRGNVGLYLKIAPGRASHSILKMAREGLLFDLRNAITRAKKENATVQKHNIQIKAGNGNGDGADSTRPASIEVTPISMPNLKEQLFMVIFQESPREAAREASPRSGKRQKEDPASIGRIAKLEGELAATKEYLQSLIETQEAMNEELQSANEEILSSNEELQSTNEELETAKEELQSANEELTTVNDELRSRNIEVNQINNDLHNLLNSIDIAVIMIGNDLTIRRFTPRAQQIYGLIAGDVGRPFFNVNPTIEIPPLQPLVLQVMSNLQTIEEEFTDSHGTRYQLRILPYRAEDRIDGAVITLVNVSALANIPPIR